MRGNTLEPYAIESIGAYLKADGFEYIHILQQFSLSDDDLTKQIIKLKPVIVGFTVLSCDYFRVLSITKTIKEHVPETKIVFGGYHPTLNTHESLEKNEHVDFVVFGEGEATFCELAHAVIYGNIEYGKIPGLAYRKASKVHVNPARCRIAKLDNLPYALRDREILKRSKQWNLSYPPPSKQTGVAQVSYSRGCLFQCNFCVSPFLWSKNTDSEESGPMTYRSTDNLISEMREVQKQYDVNFFYFNDLTINASEEKLISLCNAIISSGLHDPDLDSEKHADINRNIHWFCLAKIGISANMAQLMAKAGCSKIGFGIESFYQKGQIEMSKPYKGFSNIKDTLEHTDSVGIINRAYVVLGWENETEESINATIDGLLATKVDQIRIAYFTPFPGSLLFEDYKNRQLLIETDYTKFDGDTPVVKCNHISTEELIEARKKIIKSFYTSQVYIDRCKDKIRRFPRLKESYLDFAREIYDLSKGNIDLKEALCD
jgi:anaerobic magnesium-protoporphyrin IX monomethyl ester cyclase